MFRIEIKNSANVITNENYGASVAICEEWREDNHDYFPIDYTYEIINITILENFKKAKEKGLKNQSVGREVLAIIYAINDEKTKQGLLTQESLSAMLSDKNLQIIERLLLNGSLGSATQMIMNIPDQYFNSENKQLILNYINENK